MSGQATMRKAIKKATKQGWAFGMDTIEVRGNGVYWIGEITEIREDFATVIFSHTFAKALWGKYDVMPEADYKFSRDEGDGAIKTHFFIVAPNIVHAWQYHLQQMVISDDPIKYLEENI